MDTPIYVVDAFTDKPFAGNPAAVCILTEERDAGWMQSVAAEMKHAETAFVRAIENGYSLRWFTPTVEVDLCGHATLASAHTLWETHRVLRDSKINFNTRSGVLVATLADQICLDFPAIPPVAADREIMLTGLQTVWSGTNGMDWFLEVGSEQEVVQFDPIFSEIESLGLRGTIITAPSQGDVDFVSRFFAPQSGVPEDPVTGSAHCCLAPYWASKFGKDKLVGYQASPRGGTVGVQLSGNRVFLYGSAITLLEGVLKC